MSRGAGTSSAHPPHQIMKGYPSPSHLYCLLEVINQIEGGKQGENSNEEHAPSILDHLYKIPRQPEVQELVRLERGQRGLLVRECERVALDFIDFFLGVWEGSRRASPRLDSSSSPWSSLAEKSAHIPSSPSPIRTTPPPPSQLISALANSPFIPRYGSSTPTPHQNPHAIPHTAPAPEHVYSHPPHGEWTPPCPSTPCARPRCCVGKERAGSVCVAAGRWRERVARVRVRTDEDRSNVRGDSRALSRSGTERQECPAPALRRR